MQTKIKSILTILLIIVTTISCDNYLDLRPEDGIVREEFWKTKEDVHAGIFGIYLSLLKSPPIATVPTDGTDYAISEYLFFFGEIRGDMATPGTFVTIDQRDMATSNILSSNDLTSWHAFYRTINFCNTVIDLAPGVLAKDPTLTQTQLNNYLSEALAIRAYMYFTLARTFKNVPLKLTATLSDQNDFGIPASPQNEVLEQVAKDLALAEQYAVKDYGDTPSNKGRVTVYTINAMQTDVYLWMEKYPEALVAANKVIDSGKFHLIPASETWFSTVFAEGNSTESIFEFQFTTEILNPFYDMFSSRPEFIASPKVMDKIYGIDFNDSSNKDIRGDHAALIPGSNKIYKFTGLNNQDNKTLEQSNTHWFVYRYADILLLKAEALAELDKGNEALEIINTIRTTRKAIDLTAQNPNPASKDEVINYILDERARELAFEGKRWFDVLRNAKRNNYKRLDLLLDMALSSAPPDQQQSILTKLRNSNSHYLPINIYDLRTNNALVQNPFYK